MAQVTLTRNMTNGILKLKDNTGSPQTLTLKVAEGNFTWTVGKEFSQYRERGVLLDVRSGPQQAVTWSFECRFTKAGPFSGTPFQAYGFLTQQSGHTIVSTATTGWAPSIEIEFTITDPAGGASEVFTFAKCYVESVTPAEGDPNTISASGFDFEEEPTLS